MEGLGQTLISTNKVRNIWLLNFTKELKRNMTNDNSKISEKTEGGLCSMEATTKENRIGLGS